MASQYSVERGSHAVKDNLFLLQNLPPELQLQLLLHIPDFLSLRALVHACPIIHSRYLDNRHLILTRCLERELDGFFVDAYSTAMSRACEFGSVRTNEGIRDFIGFYERRLSNSIAIPSLCNFKLDLLQWMVAYHLTVARVICSIYSQWALSNMKTTLSLENCINEVQQSPNDDSSLTRSEQVRIYRAIYRYETYHNIFGQNESARQGSFPIYDISEIFMCLFDPWDAEAIGCIDLCLREKYEDVFLRVKSALQPSDVRFQPINNRFLNPAESYDFYLEHDGK